MRMIISVILIIVPPLTFGFSNMPTQMAIALVAGFTSAAIINIDKFEYFKAGQLEAKLVKAEKIIEEANATIEQLESVTVPLLNASLSILIYDGVFDGMDSEDKEKTLNELMKIKKVINVDSDYTNEVLERAKNSVSNFYFNDIKNAMNAGKNQYEEHFSNRSRIDHEPYKIEEINEFFAKNPQYLTSEVSRKLDKYRDILNEYYD